ncbi:MAG: FAD-dependent monooxygenase [Pseudomonadota bacterium]
MTKRKITVLGAGIAGLAVSRALALRGAEVTVVEQAEAVSEVGAGIQISPNGGVVLRALGLWDQLTERAQLSEGVVLRDYAHGRNVARLNFRSRGSFFLVHRADLIDVLHQGALEAGVRIELGSRVDSVRHRDHAVEMSFADGAERISDWVIGADGLHSTVRQTILGVRRPFFTGQVAWRAIIEAPGPLPSEAQIFMGPGRHLVAYPLRQGKLLNLVAVQERKTWALEGWTHADDPDRLRETFADFDGPVPDWLGRVDQCHIWGLFRHPVASRWFGRRIAILGDAAHPTLPFLAQGGCMALEDAWVLADSLAASSDWREGCAAYQARRAPRVQQVVHASNGNAWKYHIRNPLIRTTAHIGLGLLGHLAPEGGY